MIIYSMVWSLPTVYMGSFLVFLLSFCAGLFLRCIFVSGPCRGLILSRFLGCVSGRLLLVGVVVKIGYQLLFSGVCSRQFV